MAPKQIHELLREMFPRIRPEGRGWVLETAPNVFVPVPHPDDKLAYIAHQGRWSPLQLCHIQIALQKRVPVTPDPATVFYLEQLLNAAV